MTYPSQLAKLHVHQNFNENGNLFRIAVAIGGEIAVRSISWVIPIRHLPMFRKEFVVKKAILIVAFMFATTALTSAVDPPTNSVSAGAYKSQGNVPPVMAIRFVVAGTWTFDTVNYKDPVVTHERVTSVNGVWAPVLGTVVTPDRLANGTYGYNPEPNLIPLGAVINAFILNNVASTNYYRATLTGKLKNPTNMTEQMTRYILATSTQIIVIP